MATKKHCFIVAPIGEAGSDVRRRSDQVRKYIIKPIAQDVCGYELQRADEIAEPGIITSQIIEHVLEDELVIADLTGWNPNVFYELAIRHLVRKPFIQLINSVEEIPFDIAQNRTISFDHKDLDSVELCKEELEKQIHAIEKDPTKVDNPIAFTIDLQRARESKDPVEQSNAEIMQQLLAIGAHVRSLAVEVEMLRSAGITAFFPQAPGYLNVHGGNGGFMSVPNFTLDPLSPEQVNLLTRRRNIMAHGLSAVSTKSAAQASTKPKTPVQAAQTEPTKKKEEDTK
jgi:hypothetical protein